MENKIYQTTIEDYENFKACCMKYKDLFGIVQYDLYFKHENLDGEISNVNCDIEAKNATIFFSTEITDICREKQDWIEATALHEVLHIVLGELVYLGRRRFVCETDLYAKSEEIVNLLENIIMACQQPRINAEACKSLD